MRRALGQPDRHRSEKPPRSRVSTEEVKGVAFQGAKVRENFHPWIGSSTRVKQQRSARVLPRLLGPMRVYKLPLKASKSEKLPISLRKMHRRLGANGMLPFTHKRLVSGTRSCGSAIDYSTSRTLCRPTSDSRPSTSMGDSLL